MKIYPAENVSIIPTNMVNKNTDIPLAYVETKEKEPIFNLKINPLLKNTLKREILPYETFDKLDFMMFDDFFNKVNEEEMKKHFVFKNNKYMYIPKDSISFIPRKFIYKVTAKKNSIYKSNSLYNLNLISLNLDIADYLSKFCFNSNNKQLFPLNININENNRDKESFFEGNIIDKDFCFQYLKALDCDVKDSPFNIMNLVTKGVNSFIFYSKDFLSDNTKFRKNDLTLEEIEHEIKITEEKISNFEDLEENLEKLKKLMLEKSLKSIKVNKDIQMIQIEKEVFNIKKTNIYKNTRLEATNVFIIPKDRDDIKYYSLFSNETYAPILIEERVGQCFIVHASDMILKHLNDKNNTEVFFETMMYVYLQSYKKSEEITDWITDQPVDYIVENKNLIKKNKFLSKTEYYKIFNEEKENISLYNVEIISSPYVEYVGLDKDYLSFSKIKNYDDGRFEDIDKKDCISIYTENNDIIYIKKFHYLIFNDFENFLKVKIENNHLYTYIRPYTNSINSIDLKKTLEIDTPLYSTTNESKEILLRNPHFYLVKTDDEEYPINCISEEIFSKNNYFYLAEIIIDNEKEQNVYDMRQRGGGLSYTEKDNYDCLDIGNINGKPYRRGGTMVIKLPLKLKPYENIIRDTIDQYKVAEDYYYLIFKEEK